MPLSENKRRLLAEYIRVNGVHGLSERRTISPRPANEPIPLSYSQQQVWVHSQLAGDSPIYNEPITICRTGPLDHRLLERCMIEIVRRHEIWRTTFAMRDGEPVQVVHPPPERFPITAVDLRSLPSVERAAAALHIAEQDARKPFSLQMGPLLRMTAVRTGDEDFRLYVTFHQIVFDGVSAYRVFVPELAALYAAFAEEKPSPLAEPKLQYGDYAYWQQRSVSLGALSQQLSFWKRTLSGDLPVFEWPTGNRRPASQSYRGAVQRFAFSPKLVTEVTTFCRRTGVSSYMALLASWAVVLSRCTGQRDVIVGGMSAGRKRSDLEGLVGYFVNPLAMRIDVAPHSSFIEIVDYTRNTVLDALANDEVPFECVVKELQSDPDPGRNPVFQCILSQQPQLPEIAPGWNLITEEVSNGGSKLDLGMVIDERPGAIEGPVTFNPDVLDVATVTRIIGHWQTLLSEALRRPDAPVDELPLMTPDEHNELRIQCTGKRVDYPANCCLHHLFESQAKKTPDHVALIFGDAHLTYNELDRKSSELALLLFSRGVGPGVHVAIYLDRSIEMVVALLGVLKAGGACVPLDPTFPSDRIGSMLADAAAPLLLTRRQFVSELPPHSALVVCLDDEWPAVNEGEQSPGPRVTATSDHIAYIFYTSGSTGRPKGVQVTHRGLVNSILAMTTHYGQPVGRLLLLFSFAFDGSIPGIYWTLSTGGTLILPPDQSRWDLQDLLSLIQHHRVSHTLVIPSLYAQLLSESAPGQLASLNTVIVGGEECPKELVDRHYRLLPRTALFNEYGPTEGTVWCSVHRCEPNASSARVPIGKPIANTQMYVLDSSLALLPAGVAGELYIAGPGVARGYLNCPDLTRDRFVPNHFSKDCGYLYKTGDRVRMLPNGDFEWLGRIDNQVKIRGFRIELEEIEAVILQFGGIRQTVVTASSDFEALVAYIVASDSQFDVDELRTFLRARLPQAMVPGVFVLLESLPLMPNGKVNRRALPAARLGASIAGNVPAGDELEQALVEIWQAVLGKEGIGVTDNFFDLGGHSLLVVKLVLRIQRAFGRRLTLRHIVEAPTIRQMSALLRLPATDVNNTALVPIQPHGARRPLFWVRGGALFVQLGRRLGIEQPLIGLHLPAAEAAELPLPCKLEHIAAALIRHMKEAQPVGPYLLAGLCVNGVIAYEMACQLVDQGEQVALLALFDSLNPEYYRNFSRESRTLLLTRKIQYHARKLKGITPQGTLSFARERLTGIVRRVRFVRSMTHYALRLAPGRDRLHDLDILIHPAAYHYQPKTWPDRIAYFQSTDWPHGHYWDFHASWTKLAAGGVDVYRVTGGHESMFDEPGVGPLSEALKRELLEAETRGADVESPGVGARA